MVFSINQTQLPDAIIIQLSGRLSINEPAAGQGVEQLAADPKRLYVVDLTNLHYLDASGIGKLINLWHSIDRRSGRMVVVAASDRVKKLIEIAKLTRVFEVLDAPVCEFLRRIVPRDPVSELVSCQKAS